MKIVTVIPLKKVFFKEDLTYFSTKNVEKGDLVSITIKNKKTLGLVMSTEEVETNKVDIKRMSFNLKKINETMGRSVWRSEYIDSMLDCVKYFATTKNQVLSSLIPSVYINNYNKLTKIKNLKTIGNKQTPKVLVKNIVPSFHPKSEKLLFQAKPEDRISYYKNLIRSSFALQKSVFIVLPTKKDIDFFYHSLSKGIEDFTIPIYSTFTAKKSIEKYNQIISSTHPLLIIGTASFLSIPREDIGTVILEKENSPQYKMQFKPYIDMRIFSEIFASKIRAKFILSDTLLRFESISKKDEYSWEEVQSLCFKTNFNGSLHIIDKNDEKRKEKKFSVLDELTIEKIKENILNQKNVFIFSLRKGLATYTICKDCQETLLCTKCHSPIVLYKSKNGEKRMFVCNRCKDEKETDTLCKKCGSWNLIPLGIGTETVYEELNNIFEKEKIKSKIYILNKDTAQTRKGAEKIVKDFEENKGSVLIGTELSFFYLQNKIPLSVIASFDSLWSIPNFRMSEKIINILMNVSSRTSESMLLETRNIEDEGIIAFKNETILQFVRNELEIRKKIKYPPYQRFIKITHIGTKLEKEEAKKMLAENFKEYESEIYSGFIPKIMNNYVTNMLLKVDIKDWSFIDLVPHSSINEILLTRLLNLPSSFTVNVDPEDII